MNKVVLMGRLTRDPDIRWSQSNPELCIARYTLAVDRRQKKQDGQQAADFISCVALGKAGEFAEKYLHKGTKICISGRIQTGSYERQDGTKVYTTDVIVEEHEFAESKGQTSGRNAMDDEMAQAYADRLPSTENAGQQAAIDGFMNVPNEIAEELPF